MSDAIGRVCSLCGNTFFGYCNHGTDWSGTYENNFQKMVDAANYQTELNQKQAFGLMTNSQAAEILYGRPVPFVAELIGKPGPVEWVPVVGYGSPVPTVATEMVKEFSKDNLVFLCAKCSNSFPVAKVSRDSIKSCFYCGSLDVQPMPTPAEYFDGHYQPRCAVCGESPTAEYLASKPEDWLCCDPVPILLPRRIFSEAA